LADITNILFKDLKVLDLSSILAGPLAGSYFAEGGAEVIKIENKLTDGDATRTWKLPSEPKSQKYSAYYVAANFGKKTVMLNLTDAIDRKILENYIITADIVLSNYQKTVAQKLNLEPSDIQKLNPNAIICQLSAYDYDDPRPGYDLVMQGETGWISMNGIDNDNVAKLPVAMIDIIASHQMREGILSALWQREKIGGGAVIHVSLYKSALTALANQATNYLIAGHVAKPIGTLHPNIAPYGDVFLTKDKIKVMLAVGSDQQFEKLWNTLNLNKDNLAIFANNQQRIENRKSLFDILQKVISLLVSDVLIELLSGINVPFCLIRNLHDVLSVKDAEAMIHTQLIDGDVLRSVKNIAYTIYQQQND
jgi:crotonobetainyl-CoA:carnitine CoA-transferase CaiB-like acyl-CoA transferase